MDFLPSFTFKKATPLWPLLLAELKDLVACGELLSSGGRVAGRSDCKTRCAQWRRKWVSMDRVVCSYLSIHMAAR